jgi:hypothetical protein
VKIFKTLLILLAIAGIVFSTYTPAQTKQGPCCSCCKGSVCTCDCSSKGPPGPSFGGLQKDGADGKCDFNKCDNKKPVTVRNNFLLSSTDGSQKKKLASGMGHSLPAGNMGFFPAAAVTKSYDGHLSLPPPLFLKNSCLLL